MYFLLLSRDPMDALLLEQHLRTPLRLFPEPMMPQFNLQDADGMASAALLEKARQHLQMWGRSPYAEMLLPQVYQRPNMGGLNLGLWQGQWPQLPPGFLTNPAILQQHQQQQAQLQQQQQQLLSRTPPPPSSTPQQSSAATTALSITSTSSSSGSPSPSEMRSKHFARFSPYPLPMGGGGGGGSHHHQQHLQHQAQQLQQLQQHSPPSSRGSPNNSNH